jgi:hypothetical protein
LIGHHITQVSTGSKREVNPGNFKTAVTITIWYKRRCIEKYSDASSRESFIRTATVRLMSTPEYQLC